MLSGNAISKDQNLQVVCTKKKVNVLELVDYVHD